jgi:anti-sigma factor (TIGR02949 family)
MNESAQPAGGAKLGTDARPSSIHGGIQASGSRVTLQERGGSSDGRCGADVSNRNSTTVVQVTCTDVRTQLNDLLDGSLDRPTRERLERHLLQCSDCAALYRTLQQTTRGLRSLDRVRIPDGMRERLAERLKQQQRTDS